MKYLSSIFLFIINLSIIYSQINSLDMNLDPRAIALGESFVANPNGLIVADNNPATLAGIRYTSIIYTKRNINWFEGTKGMYFYSIGAVGNTPIGNFAFTYKRFDMGEIETTSVSSPYGDGGKAKPYDHTFILSYARQLIGNFVLGMNLKTHKYVDNIIIGNIKSWQYNTPVIIDIGILYNIEKLLQRSIVNDKMFLGVALENFGTDYKGSYQGVEHILTIPRYFKIGFTYELAVPNKDSSNLFKFVFTGQYKNELNSYDKSGKDFWSTGFEASFYDLLSIRIGGSVQPHRSIFGDKGILTVRYGFGIIFLLEKFGIEYPFSILFDYAVMPINARYLSSFWKAEKKNLDAFNIQLVYNSGLF
jgi:hypothetical protein